MTEADDKSLSRGISSDMSSEAIARRLDIASQLYELARTLGEAEYLGPVESLGSSPGRDAELREPDADYQESHQD